MFNLYGVKPFLFKFYTDFEEAGRTEILNFLHINIKANLTIDFIRREI
jgi:hypothetical protein